MEALKIALDRAGVEPVAVGMVLGSGLAAIADMVEGVAIPYADLPGFPKAGVSGHKAALVIGRLEGVRVAVFGGRAHYYETGDAAVMRGPLALLQRLGADRLILTNAAGSLRSDIAPGDLMMLSDHINFSGRNPLIGEPSDARFVNMTEAYDHEMRAALRAAAEAEAVALPEGLCLVFRPLLRDAGGDPGPEGAGGGCSGDVDRAGGDPRELPGAAGGGDLDRDQHGGRAVGRGDQP